MDLSQCRFIGIFISGKNENRTYHWEGEGEMKKKEKYNANIKCRNCGHKDAISVKKGTPVRGVACPKCGCKELELKNEPFNPFKPCKPLGSFVGAYTCTTPITPIWYRYDSTGTEPCRVEEFFKENPKGICGIYCPCPKCIPRY